ncbi:UNVERIFIED_CONTAM: Mitochondrial distribution and morphology protein 12 [Siphonaria sp. JEL0065]|nr:Mitochondrial distribution and morphology protein 12 [Siphonaria sp. JEL0065]
MSLDINWLLLDAEVARQAQNWLNERLQELDDRRPAFLGKLTVENLDFGSIPPVIAIQDITNVIDEFYLPDEFDIFNPQLPTTTHHLAQLLAQTSLDHSNINDSSSAASSRHQSPQKHVDHLHNSGTHHHSMPSKQKTMSVEDMVSQYAHAMRRETDIQIEILVDYKGDFRFTVNTELIVNQPTPAFITLPLSLSLTGFSFTAVAVISYLGDRINFCFKETSDNRGLFNEIHIESEIGDKERPSGILKNVGKIEKFVMDQVRTLVSDNLVYPNYHCLSLINENDDEGGQDGVDSKGGSLDGGESEIPLSE